MMSAQNLDNYPSRVGHSESSQDKEAELKRPDPFPYAESEDIPLAEDYTPTKRTLQVDVCARGQKPHWGLTFLFVG